VTPSPLFVPVKRQLVSLLSARIGGDDTSVFYAWERGRATTREALWLENSGDAVQSNTPVATGQARHPRHETFTVDVVIQVADDTVESDQADEVEARVAELYGEVDDLLADDKTLGGLDGVLEAKVVGYTPEPVAFSGKGYAFRWVARVWFNTWIT
jgi:hypothetical protein